MSDSQTIIAAGHEGHGHHDPDVPHQFDDLEQKNLTDTLGMWTFLATEVLFFGALFATLMLYRSLFTKEFVESSKHLVVGIGLFNTFVLLASSYTVVLTVHAAKQGNNKQIIIWLVATIVLGMTFLGMKVVEYSKDFNENLVPNWPRFGISKEASDSLDADLAKDPNLLIVHPERYQQALVESKWDVPVDREHAGDARLFMRHAQLFYVFYYTMTMIHAIHMVIGLGIFAFLIYRCKKGAYTPRKHAQIEISGLYWHFVDIVWIFLFPLLYLIR